MIRRGPRRSLALAVFIGLVVPGCRSAPTPEPPVPRSPQPVQGITSGVQGEALYKAEDYPGAAWIFEQVVAGAIAGDRERAQFWLGKSFFKLDDYERSAAVMIEIARDPEHPYQSLAIPWLVTLHDERPDDRAILQVIGQLAPALIDDEAFDAVRGDLLTAIGEHQLRSRDPERALATLSSIQEYDGDWGKANLWAGRAAAQLGRTSQAVDHFRIAATWNVPTRKERRKRERKGRVDPHRDRVAGEARAELERLGSPLED